MTANSPAISVLIVEDDAVTLETYARILQIEGYDVRTAHGAVEGWHAVESRRPDAIIVDLRMPDVDGLAFLRRLRDREEHRDIPVGVVTGDYNLDETVRAELQTPLQAELRYKPLWIDDLTLLIWELVTKDKPGRPSL